MSNHIILQIQNVSRIFAYKISALKNVSFNVEEGDFIIIAGSNGSGKTVLMNLIAGLDTPTEGQIIVSEGFEAGLVFQDADCQILGETPEEDVSFGARNCGLKGVKLKERVDRSLESSGLLEKKNYPARTMSGGEKRRLAVAGILAMERRLIIFDEPFANLDWPGVKQVNAILQKLKTQGKTIIVLTHEIEKVLFLSNRFIVLDRGILRFDGNPEEGLKLPLEQWGIKNPINSYKKFEDLLWK